MTETIRRHLMRYHLSENGQASPCKATKRECPLGGAPHGDFESPEQANQWAEQELANQYKDSLASVKIAPTGVADELMNKDGSFTMPADTYELVDGDELTDQLRNIMYEADINDNETKPVRLPDGTIMAVMKVDTQYSNGYYATVAVPAKRKQEFATTDIKGTEFHLNASDSFTTFETDDGDFGFVINGEKYSVANGDKMPKA